MEKQFRVFVCFLKQTKIVWLKKSVRLINRLTGNTEETIYCFS